MDFRNHAIKITGVLFAIAVLFMMIMKFSTTTEQDVEYNDYGDYNATNKPDIEDLEGDCGGSYEQVVNTSCNNFFYEFPEQTERKLSPRLHNVHKFGEMVSISNCCNNECTKLDLTALCYPSKNHF